MKITDIVIFVQILEGKVQTVTSSYVSCVFFIDIRYQDEKVIKGTKSKEDVEKNVKFFA